MSSMPGPTAATPLLQAHHASSSYSPGEGDTASRSHSPLPHHIRRVSLSPLRRRRHRRPSPSIKAFPALVVLLLLTFLAFIAWDVSSYGNCRFKPLCRILGSGRYQSEEVWWRNAGAYAPWRSRGDGGGKRNLPRGCEIDQVNILHRHTARYPTSSSAECMRKSLEKLENREIKVPRRHAELAFLNKADLQMTGWKFDELMDQGRKSAWRSGRDLTSKYHAFLEDGLPIFSRSAGGGRVVETGQYWLQGAQGDAFKIRAKDNLPQLDFIIPEASDANNTLSVHSCPAYENALPPPGELEKAQLYHLLEDAARKLNNALRPQPLLDIEDIICLGDMCAYDSQAEGEDWEGWSRWCSIFTRDEWEILGYMRDVERYYEVGQGSKYGKTMGAGWINELIARLTDSVPQDTTTTNRTLDSNEKSFPRGGKRLFVDFTHDNEMIEIITAMNIHPQHRPPTLDGVPTKRTYVLSNMIPFGAHLIVERIACDLADWEPDPNSAENGHDDRSGDGKKDYVRIFLNDKLLQVDDIDCKQSGFVEHGMCEVESFLASQAWSREEVDWNICFP